MNYIGEHLMPGTIGRILLVISLVSSLLATIAYARSTNSVRPDEILSWRRLARTLYIIDAFSVFTIFALIYTIIANHYFEYYYAWNHSDKSLAPKYLLSSIWEGQEGSFLLWTFWHAVLGLILMKTAKKWEGPVMTVLSFAQFCLATMILGIYVFNIKIGSSPFILLRHTDMLAPGNAPVFYSAAGTLRSDYLDLINRRGGMGLNQLLQNYWMVIHPPILFLGFASTIVPFGYAMGSLWKKDYTGWTKAALPWALFSGAILALGIMMGARWAYESLSFGGYWAWDPVENASLVPWLMMVAGIHTLLVFNSTRHSLRATYIFFVLSFLLVLYSTYLTRSGDLQDTSVHAFVDSGMNWQLRGLVLVFLFPALGLLIGRYKKIPHIDKEESSYSREFWMFIGSLVLFLSSIAIITATSLPVINKIFGTHLDVGEEREFSYNRIQIFVALIIGLLTGLTQFFRYKNTGKAEFAKRIFLPTVVSLVLSLAISLFGNIHYDKFGIGFLIAIHLAIFGSVYAIVGNAAYLWTQARGRLSKSGASIAHIGFGIFLLGVLISSAKKEVLSINTLNPLNFGPDKKQEGMENMTLFQGIRTDMGKYWVTYEKDTTSDNGRQTYFHILMEKKDGTDKFMLYPDMIKNTKGQQGVSMNPDAKHYWNKDIFTYTSYSDKVNEGPDTASFRNQVLGIKDTAYFSEGFMILDSVLLNPRNDRVAFSPADTAIMAFLHGASFNGQRFRAEPFFYFNNRQVRQMPDTVIQQGMAIRLNKIIDGKFELGIKESTKLTPFVALKVLQFPFINLVWLGTIIMITGFVMSMIRRFKLV